MRNVKATPKPALSDVEGWSPKRIDWGARTVFSKDKA